MAFLEVAGGAIVGGGVSLATTLFVEDRRGKVERAKEERATRREQLRVLRLLESECSSNRASLSVIRERPPEKWYPPSIPMLTSVWEAHKGDLALYPDPELWAAVESLYDLIWSAEHTTGGSPEEAPIRRENIEHDCETADRVVRLLRAAIADVEKL